MSDRTYNLNGGFKPTMKRFADLDGPDFFRTPRWATFALADNEKFQGDIWECACGDGAMSRVFEEAGYQVFSSDLYQRGYGGSGIDFLAPQRSADNIITNPPYNCAEGFVASGIKHAKRKFARRVGCRNSAPGQTVTKRFGPFPDQEWGGSLGTAGSQHHLA